MLIYAFEENHATTLAHIIYCTIFHIFSPLCCYLFVHSGRVNQIKFWDEDLIQMQSFMALVWQEAGQKIGLQIIVEAHDIDWS